MVRLLQILGVLICFCLGGCNEDQNNYKFLFVGHSYDWGNEKGNDVDPRLLKIPVSEYDGFWFGGDVCSETSLDPRTLRKLDNHFNLHNPNTHIVLGNHDYRNGNHELYYEVTGRPSFYTSGFNNLVVSVLNTNLNSSDCENLNAQFKMLEIVTDSIMHASHYVMLMHHQIFPLFDGMKDFKSNGILDNYAMNCHEASSYFVKTVYPLLLSLERRGVEVIVVVGDSGWNKGTAAETNGGVTFLASGINNSYNKKKKMMVKDNHEDKLLMFELDTKSRSFDWEFVKLNELAAVERDIWFSIE